MEQHNWWLTEELGRMRYQETQRGFEREQLLAQHGLDLWSLLRRAVTSRFVRPAAPAAEPISAPLAEERARIAA